VCIGLLNNIPNSKEFEKIRNEIENILQKAKNKLNDIISEKIKLAEQSTNFLKKKKLLEEGLQIDPDNEVIKEMLKTIDKKIDEEVTKLYFKGVDYYAEDKLKEAIKVWEEALQLKPNHKRISVDLARAKEKAKLLGL
jgi:tetratricopeptide (TPR) repeat protein